MLCHLLAHMTVFVRDKIATFYALYHFTTQSKDQHKKLEYQAAAEDAYLLATPSPTNDLLGMLLLLQLFLLDTFQKIIVGPK